MAEDLYVVAITALLPLTACMVVFQVNPYHALVIRGILGAVAALVYALFGAADVALTEALVGTMLSITLYAVAVRSSLTMRVGILESELSGESSEQLFSALRKTLSKYHLRLEKRPYTNAQALQAALSAKEIHTILSEQWIAWESLPSTSPEGVSEKMVGETKKQTRRRGDAGTRRMEMPTKISFTPPEEPPPYHIQTRIQRLYEILAEIPPTLASLTYINSETLNQSEVNHEKRREVYLGSAE
ncbi:MAG: DUF4040 domain-containing protein [Symploca sp. SIO3E6]|nr:DUF4040 domain-containing protein [Caldora sp. SIO3E6]